MTLFDFVDKHPVFTFLFVMMCLAMLIAAASEWRKKP